MYIYIYIYIYVTDMSYRSSPCVIIILKFDLKVNKNGLTRLFFIGIIDDQYQISTLCTLSEVCAAMLPPSKV